MRLYALELKRVLTTRTTWIILAVLLLLALLTAYLPVTYVNYQYANASGEVLTLEGRPAIEKIKERCAAYAGTVTADRFGQALEQYQAGVLQYGPVNDPAFPLDAYNEYIQPSRPLTRLLQGAYTVMDTGTVPGVMDLTEADAQGFYTQNRQHLIDLLAMEQRDYPDAQAKALAQYDKIETPFVYYPGYNADAVDYFSLYLFLLVIACTVITAPVFSSEYQTQSDDILRSTKRGRGRLAAIKIASALTVALGAWMVGSGTYLLLSNTFFGWETVQSSIQMLFSGVSLPNMTILQMLLAVALAGLISLFSVTGCTLFLSARIKNPAIALTVALCVCLSPSILSVLPRSNPVLWLQSILPSGGIGLLNCFQYALTDFNFLHIGRFCIWQPSVLMGIAAIEIPLFIALTVRTYMRHTA